MSWNLTRERDKVSKFLSDNCVKSKVTGELIFMFEEDTIMELMHTIGEQDREFFKRLDSWIESSKRDGWIDYQDLQLAIKRLTIGNIVMTT